MIAGTLAGPLAMIPALLFFVCMVAYYPEIGVEALPSDFLLQRLVYVLPLLTFRVAPLDRRPVVAVVPG